MNHWRISGTNGLGADSIIDTIDEDANGLSLTGCAAHVTHAFTQLSNRLSTARRRQSNAFYSRKNA